MKRNSEEETLPGLETPADLDNTPIPQTKQAFVMFASQALIRLWLTKSSHCLHRVHIVPEGGWVGGQGWGARTSNWAVGLEKREGEEQCRRRVFKVLA